MNKKIKGIFFLLVTLSIFAGFNTVQAKTDEVIHFNDKYLEKELCDNYNCEEPITKKMAHEFSTEDGYISFSDKNISDLEGLQYFDGLTSINFYDNRLTNLEPLSKLPLLNSLHITNN